MSEEQPDQTLQLEPYCLTLTSSHQRRTLTLEVYFRCLGRMRISSTGSIFRIRFEGNAEFIKLALRKEVPIVPLISTGAHDTLIVLTDFYDQVRQLHEAGLLWPFGIDPEVFPMYLGLPWGLGIGPVPNIPLPASMQIRMGKPIRFDHYGEEASKDEDYVLICYDQGITRCRMPWMTW